MHFLQNLSNLFIIFSNTSTLLIIIILGLLFFEKQFLVPTLLILFTIIFSALLKAVFAVPFPPELVQKLGKEGFSFPSGHMQSSVVFYGCFLLLFKNIWLRLTLLVVITGIGFSLIYKEYHNIYDILGASFFGTLTIGVYYLACFLIKLKKPQLSEKVFTSILISFLSTFLMITLFLLNNFQLAKILIMIMWIIYGLTISFLISAALEKKSYQTSYLIWIILGLIGIFGLFLLINPRIFLLQTIKWLFLSSSLPFISSLVRKLNLTTMQKSDSFRINSK